MSLRVQIPPVNIASTIAIDTTGDLDTSRSGTNGTTSSNKEYTLSFGYAPPDVLNIWMNGQVLQDTLDMKVAVKIERKPVGGVYTTDYNDTIAQIGVSGASSANIIAMPFIWPIQPTTNEKTLGMVVKITVSCTNSGGQTCSYTGIIVQFKTEYFVI